MDISFESGLAPEDIPAVDRPEVRVLFDRADGLLSEGRAEEALWPLLDATEAAPDLWLTHYRYAELLLAVGDARARDALPAAEAARELRPAFPSTHTLYGLGLEARGNRAGARSSYRHALELDPDHVGAHNNLASLDLRSWRLGRASSHLAAALGVSPASRATRVNLALVATRMGLRLLAALAVCALVLAVILGLDTSDATRAVVGAGLVGVVAIWALTSWRALPRGARGTAVGTIPRLPRITLGLALVVATASVGAMAFAPRELAANVGALALAVVLNLAFLAVVVGWLFSRRRRPRRQ